VSVRAELIGKVVAAAPRISKNINKTTKQIVVLATLRNFCGAKM
jgi:hypothetical protein